MNFGAPELIVLLIVGVLFLGVTIYACVRAYRNGDTPWLVGILVAWFFGAGWIVGLIYVLGFAPDRSGAPPRPLGGPPLPPPTGSAAPVPVADAGWYADPSSRFELRYWDGARWTEHVSRNGQQSTDPATAP